MKGPDKKKRSKRVNSAAAATAIVCIGAVAVAQDTGGSVEIDEAQARDLYLAGQQVQVSAPVDGDVVAAGETVTIDGTVSGDVIAAGATVTISHAVGDDVRAAGQSIRIAAAVAGHVVAAGEHVVVEADQDVADWAWLAGAQIEVLGSVGALRAAGERVTIAGEVRGDAHVASAHFELRPGAVVRGDLILRGQDQPVISEDARVDGEVIRHPSADDSGPGFDFITLFALVLAVAVLRFAFPTFVPQVGETARRRWLGSLGAGLGLLLVVPVTAVLLFITSIGWVLGVMLLLSYGVLLVFGGLMGLYAVSTVALTLAGRRPGTSATIEFAAIGSTVFAMMLISRVPYVSVVSLLVFLLGVGAVGLHGLRRDRAQL